MNAAEKYSSRQGCGLPVQWAGAGSKDGGADDGKGHLCVACETPTWAAFPPCHHVQ